MYHYYTFIITCCYARTSNFYAICSFTLLVQSSNKLHQTNISATFHQVLGEILQFASTFLLRANEKGNNNTARTPIHIGTTYELLIRVELNHGLPLYVLLNFRLHLNQPATYCLNNGINYKFSLEKLIGHFVDLPPVLYCE